MDKHYDGPAPGESVLIYREAMDAASGRNRNQNQNMSVRAKFKCTEITRRSWSKGGTVKLSPVTASDKSPENRAFWNATPSGEISMHIENPSGFAAFELDKEYYVDFTPSD